MLKLITLVCCSCVTFFSLTAQDTLRTDTAIHLKEVVITYQAGKTTPVTFQNIGKKEIDAQSTGQEPSFLLAATPAITVYSDAGNTQGYSYFRLRGIDQTRINITLDGVPLNEPEDQGAYFSNYPDILNSASKIQIQRGVGTSKNGTAGYGGSIQLFSPDLTDSTRTQIGADYGTFNSFRIFGSYNSGIKKRKAVYIRASQLSSDGYKYNSSNNSGSVFFSGGLFLKKSTLKLNILAGRQKNELAWLGVPDSLIKIDRRTNANKNEHDRFGQALVQLQHNLPLSAAAALQSGVYYTYLKGNYDFNLNHFLGLPSTGELYNYAFVSHLPGVFSNYIYTKKQFSYTAGVHANWYSRRHTGSINTQGQLYQNTGYKNETGYFTKAAYRLGKFSFFADLQYRTVIFKYAGAVPFTAASWQFFNPKAGISAVINKNLVLYYSAGQAGREPTRNDMFGGNDDLLTDSAGNALLFIKDPEQVVNHELGIRYTTATTSVYINYYLMRFKNEIVLDGKFGPNGLALTNDVEKSFRTGVEITWAVKPAKNLSLLNNSSFNYSRIKEQGIAFAPILTPAVIINQQAAYSSKTVTLALAGRYQSSSYIDFANSSRLKSYFLLNARIACERKKIQLAAFINNITGSRYFNNGYVDFDGTKKYFVQAPVNYSVAVKYSF